MHTTFDYPERHAYEMAKKLCENLQKIGDYANEVDASLRYSV